MRNQKVFLDVNCMILRSDTRRLFAIVGDVVAQRYHITDLTLTIETRRSVLHTKQISKVLIE